MVRVFIYNTITGSILRAVSCQEADVELQLNPDEGYITATTGDDSTHYVNSGFLAEKQNFSLTPDKLTLTADGVDEVVVTGVPVGTTVSANGFSILVDDGSLEFSTEKAGVNKITFSNEPVYKETTLEVTGIV